jgi:hypothetical protein
VEAGIARAAPLATRTDLCRDLDEPLTGCRLPVFPMIPAGRSVLPLFVPCLWIVWIPPLCSVTVLLLDTSVRPPGSAASLHNCCLPAILWTPYNIPWALSFGDQWIRLLHLLMDNALPPLSLDLWTHFGSFSLPGRGQQLTWTLEIGPQRLCASV